VIVAEIDAFASACWRRWPDRRDRAADRLRADAQQEWLATDHGPGVVAVQWQKALLPLLDPSRVGVAAPEGGECAPAGDGLRAEVRNCLPWGRSVGSSCRLTVAPSGPAGAPNRAAGSRYGCDTRLTRRSALRHRPRIPQPS
jgi:hypothetical protein